MRARDSRTGVPPRPSRPLATDTRERSGEVRRHPRRRSIVEIVNDPPPLALRRWSVLSGTALLVGATLVGFKGVAILLTGDQPALLFEISPVFLGLGVLLLRRGSGRRWLAPASRSTQACPRRGRSVRRPSAVDRRHPLGDRRTPARGRAVGVRSCLGSRRLQAARSWPRTRLMRSSLLRAAPDSRARGARGRARRPT